MPRFLIEVPHEEESVSCIKAIQILFDTGNHFLLKADFGCKDGVHKAWLIVDVDTKEEARLMVPPAYREATTVIQLNSFTSDELDDLLESHKGKSPSS